MQFLTYYYSKYLYDLEHPLWFGAIISPQNQILLVLSELGVFGIIIFTMLILYLIICVIKIKLSNIDPETILLFYMANGLLLHIVGRMIIRSTFTMNQSLFYLLLILPVLMLYKNKKQII